MNYFLTRRHYARVAVVPPRCFAGKLGGTRVSLDATGLFLSSLPTQPPLAERALFMSRQARRVAAPLSFSLPRFPFFLSPLPFSLSACSTSCRCAHTGEREEAYATPSLWLFSVPASLSLRCPGETVIDVRARRNRPSLPSLLSLPSDSRFLSLSLPPPHPASTGSLCAALFPSFLRDMEAGGRRWINLSTAEPISLNEIAR